jgi:hypothetical protein
MLMREKNKQIWALECQWEANFFRLSNALDNQCYNANKPRQNPNNDKENVLKSELLFT